MRDPTLNRKHLLEFIKKRSKAHQKKMSRESALKFEQWKTVCENYKPIRVCLWLVYKITDNNYRLQLFTEFI